MKRTVYQGRLAGMSLVEMMVAIFIMSAGMIGFTLLFTSTWRSNKFIVESGVTAMQVNRASAEVVSTLRKVRQADNGDYPLELGDDFELKAYVDIDADGVTERVHYWLDSGTDQLKRGVTEPSSATPPTYAASDDSVTILANYIVNEATEPLFYYYNENYPGDTINNPLTTLVEVDDVRLVRVLLRMNIDPVRAPNNINVETFVDLRNLEYYGN